MLVDPNSVELGQKLVDSRSDLADVGQVGHTLVNVGPKLTQIDQASSE